MTDFWEFANNRPDALVVIVIVTAYGIVCAIRAWRGT